MRHPILWSLLLVVHTQPARASEPCIAPASECVKQKNSESDTAVRNVNRTPLAMCSQKPLTGWFRDGFCKTDQNDRGRHLVCAQMTDAFLKFTKARGNDLSTPSPRYRFPGLAGRPLVSVRPAMGRGLRGRSRTSRRPQQPTRKHGVCWYSTVEALQLPSAVRPRQTRTFNCAMTKRPWFSRL